VPDPTTAGPPWILIGNEGGIQPQVSVIPAQPVNYEYNRRVPTMLNITDQSLALMPAERVDVIVDFSQFAGKTLIVYNDNPAPMPLYDSRNDLYTGKPDETAIGGAPTISPGFGPNTRTVMQIRVGGCPSGGCKPFNITALQSALPKAYKATQDPPIVPQSAYNAAFGTTNTDTWVSNLDDTVNLLGGTHGVSTIVAAVPGSGYTTAPTVSFVTRDGNGAGAAATACLNGANAITVTNAGAGYTAAPTVTLAPDPADLGLGGTAAGTPAGWGAATAVASISGGGVSAITIVNPGCNYTLNPFVTVAAPSGCVINGTTCVQATAISGVTLGGVGSVNVTSPGSGYKLAPIVYLRNGGGVGATAAAMLVGDTVIGMKNITEGFEPWYGRINVMLGTTPVPLDPLAPAPQVPGIAQYIDPPSDFWDDGKIYVFRIAHLGVDSHIVHFHLANLQVINRVDFTNDLMPPNPTEYGWKESIRTNPFTDLIVAVKPKSQSLPFQIPHSSRLMDPTTPAGSTANYVQVAPVPGLPNQANISNVVTDYGWEYVWHCHLLGHEENDMMRPIVFNVTPPTSTAAPSAPNIGTVTSGQVPLSWTYTATADYVTNFHIQRSTDNTFATGVTDLYYGGLPVSPTTPGGTTYAYTDASNTTSGTYYYQLRAENGAGASNWSSASFGVQLTIVTVSAPTNLTAQVQQSGPSVLLSWTANTSNVTNFQVERNGVVLTSTVAPTATTYTDSTVAAGNTYTYRVAAINPAAINSPAYSGSVPVTVPPPAITVPMTAAAKVWRPTTGTWYTLSGGITSSTTLGTSGDVPLQADFDGDGKPDAAVWRPTTGMWYIRPSSAPGTISTKSWGASGDIPIPGDYDGDGKTDLAVWRPTTGVWYILPSGSPGSVVTKTWGTSGDTPVPMDYDGDGKADVAVWRGSTGTWYIVPSSNPGAIVTQGLGTSGDIPVPTDYNHDGKADLAVWRPSTGTWYIIPSGGPVTIVSTVWGTSTDIPTPYDFDGDGKPDLAFWRPGTGTWFAQPSGTPGGLIITQWGTSGDVPISPITKIVKQFR